jgi:hypothetical protein
MLTAHRYRIAVCNLWRRNLKPYLAFAVHFLSDSARVAQRVRSLNLTTPTNLSPIRRGFAPGFVNYKKGCTRLASDKVYQLFVHGWWFSPGTPASSITQTGRHDIAEILLKVALNTKKHHLYIKFLLVNLFS